MHTLTRSGITVSRVSATF